MNGRRKALDLQGTLQDMVTTMSEGNPGAINVMIKLIEQSRESGIEAILNMEDMNLRGSQIWVAYKDWAGQSLSRLKTGLHERDPELIRCVNYHCLEGMQEEAVERGGSYR